MKKRRIHSLVLWLAVLLLLSSAVGCTANGGPVAECPPDSMLLPQEDDHTPRDSAGKELSPKELAGDIASYTIGDVLYLSESIRGAYIYEPRLILLQSRAALDTLFSEKSTPDVYDVYGDDFFEKQDLLLVGIESSSGGTRYEVTNLARDAEGILTLDVTRLLDGDTTDIGFWQITIPLPKNAVAAGEQIRVREIPRTDLDLNTTVEDTVCFSSPLNGLYDEPLAKPFLLVGGDEVARFAAWYNLTSQYAMWAQNTAADTALLIVPVRAEFAGTTYAITHALSEDEATLHVTVREHRDAEGVRIADEAYHLILPLTLTDKALPAIDLTYEQDTAPLPGAAPSLYTLHVGKYGALPKAQPYLCLRSAEELALLLRVSGITPALTINGIHFDTTDDAATYAVYDQAFFAEHDLLLIPRTEGSGSIRHRVLSLARSETGVVVDIARLSPPVGTADMAYWTFLIPTEKNTMPDQNGVKVRYTTVHISQRPIERGTD